MTLSAQAFLVKGKATVPMYGETACLGSLRVSMEDTRVDVIDCWGTYEDLWLPQREARTPVPKLATLS